ncbi:hypothetical protein [Lysinibacillus fusiformis]|uniref:hypothetical protein n=1 Tax=Lysinibacillus fusiformis TaxID=28031 RepID=UPI00263B2D3D|nr:hypothetical protein [Lysinibacillus fusiformis]MDC6267249.1 hypothetical protein [Lysinibacillus sphaericus]MDN4968317.1 hypothetical protein [Lysinibacillus fusiformis]MDN4968491.1 hypothetical protein [Lysinibacillus fusiformis]
MTNKLYSIFNLESVHNTYGGSELYLVSKGYKKQDDGSYYKRDKKGKITDIAIIHEK